MFHEVHLSNPCQYELLTAVFCTETKCDDNCENYDQVEIMETLQRYKHKAGCSDVQICSKLHFRLLSYASEKVN